MFLVSTEIIIFSVILQRIQKKSIVNKINNLRKYIIKADEQVDMDSIRTTMNILINDIEETQKLGHYQQKIIDNLGLGLFIIFLLLISSFVTLIIIGQINLFLLLGIVADLVLYYIWYKGNDFFLFK